MISFLCFIAAAIAVVAIFARKTASAVKRPSTKMRFEEKINEYFAEVERKAESARGSELVNELTPRVLSYMESIKCMRDHIVVCMEKVYFFSEARYTDGPLYGYDIYNFHEHGYRNLSLIEQEALAKCISGLMPGFCVEMHPKALGFVSEREEYRNDPVHYRPVSGWKEGLPSGYQRYSFCYITITSERMHELEQQAALRRKAEEEQLVREERERYVRAF